MNGLERIIRDISAEAEREASELLEVASESTAKIAAEAERERVGTEKEFTQKTREECARLAGSIEATAAADGRETVLSARARAAEEILKYVRQTLENATDDEYFDFFLKLVKKNSEEGDGVMLLSKRDFERLPPDFEERVNKNARGRLTLAENTDNEDLGFILRYGKIDVNCSFDSLFNEKKNELYDLINKNFL